jgi:hypothetical protein
MALLALCLATVGQAAIEVGSLEGMKFSTLKKLASLARSLFCI